MPCVSEMAAAIGSAHLQLLSHPHAMICPSIEIGERVMAGKNNVAYQQAWRVAKAFTSGALAQGENVVWSPACVASLLAIMREGSSGVTRKELDELLGKVSVPSRDVLVWRDIRSYEDEDVWSDEEIAGWCRVTDEEDAKKGIHEITCGIYGSMVHTVFVGSYPEAAEKVDAIKRELKEYVMGCKDGTIDQNA